MSAVLLRSRVGSLRCSIRTSGNYVCMHNGPAIFLCYVTD